MKRFLCLILLATCWPLGLHADGKVFRAIGYARVEIPDQRALIHYSNGVQRLVIDTSFVGPGTNFAWVVPLPAIPRIEAVSSAVFTTLPVIFQPKVVLRIARYWIAVLVMGVILWLVVCISRVKTAALRWLLIVLSCVALYNLLVVPAGKAKAGADSALAVPQVQVLQRERVGVFDTVTLTAGDPGTLTTWLTTNGFATPASATPVIADYVRDGWVFTAARLVRSTNTTDSTSPHPLSFTFNTRRPVYPLRLTGVDNGPCTIDLYVFGPQRVEVPGFRVTRCDGPTYNEVFDRPQFEGGKVRVRHAELAALVNGAPVATKLTGTLTPAQMRRDAYLRWVPYRGQGATLYPPDAAFTLAANAGSVSLLLSAVVAWFVYRPRSRRPLSPYWFLKPLCLALVVSAFVFLLTPQAAPGEVEVTHRSGRSDAKRISLNLRMALEDEKMQKPSIEDLDRIVKGLGLYYRGDSLDQPVVRNWFTGDRVRLERSPGNIWVESSTNGLEVIWHDFDGAPGLTNRVF